MDTTNKTIKLEGEEKDVEELVSDVPGTADMGAQIGPEDVADSGAKNDCGKGNELTESNNSEEETTPATPTEPTDTSAEDTQEEAPILEENGVTETSIKTFTQDDVDKLVGDTRVRTREKTFNYIYNRYGVKSEEELDSLVANAQRYDTQKEMYDADRSAWEKEKDDSTARLNEMSEQIALMQSEIDPARYEDAKLILKGKGMDVTLENIQGELETHPEWKKEEPKPEPNPIEEKPAEVTRIKALGNEQKPAPTVSEEEQAEKLFKMKFH